MFVIHMNSFATAMWTVCQMFLDISDNRKISTSEKQFEQFEEISQKQYKYSFPVQKTPEDSQNKILRNVNVKRRNTSIVCVCLYWCEMPMYYNMFMYVEDMAFVWQIVLR